MVAPSSTGSSLDILLKFTLDAAANDRVKSGVSTIGEELKKLEGSFPGAQLGKETDKFNEQLKQTEVQAKKTSAALRAEAKVLSAQAAETVNSLKRAQIGALKEVSSQVQSISNIALAGGVGLLGGIFSLANDYVKNAKVATDVTRQWEVATASLKASQTQVGAVLAKEALPMLKQAAELADRASDFVESHPQIVGAALNAGKILTTLAIAGTLASKGIKLYADAKYLLTIPAQLEAARLQDAAAKKQLEAALLRAKELGVPIPPTAQAGGLLGLISPVALIVAGVIASKYAVDIVNQVLNATGAAKVIADAQQRILETSKHPYPGIIVAARDGGGGTTAMLGTKRGRTAVSGTAGDTSAAFASALQAYEQYRQSDLDAHQKHYADRKKIIGDALAAEQKANADYASSVAKVRTQTSSALAGAAKDFARANEQAETDYQNQRAQIVRDGNQSIEQMQKDLQERLRKNEQEHATQVGDLTASRDALGLAKENRRFAEEQSEARREGSQEIKQRRAEIAQRLADLAQSYEQERAQRLADQQARIAEIQENARQQLAELAAQRAEELRQIQAQKVEKIRELDSQFAEERKRRYQYFLQQVSDLDASLLGEKRLRDKYQALMIQDLNKFLGDYRTKAAGLLGSPPGNAAGGYVSGIVRTGERGYEYVLSHDTTRAAESVIGGRLNQQNLIAALSGMNQGGAGVVWHDNRRFSGEYTQAMRREIAKDTIALLKKDLAG